jgi:hypothetical protein
MHSIEIKRTRSGEIRKSLHESHMFREANYQAVERMVIYGLIRNLHPRPTLRFKPAMQGSSYLCAATLTTALRGRQSLKIYNYVHSWTHSLKACIYNVFLSEYHSRDFYLMAVNQLCKFRTSRKRNSIKHANISRCLMIINSLANHMLQGSHFENSSHLECFLILINASLLVTIIHRLCRIWTF